jgi:hypothetical protein
MCVVRLQTNHSSRKYSAAAELVAEPAVQGAPDNLTFVTGHLRYRKIEGIAEKQRTATDSI